MLIMAHGLNSVVLKRNPNTIGIKTEGKAGGIGSRRIFAPQFKLQVLDSYRNDADCKGNQRATARKYGIHRRQIQKWLQVETNLRNSVMKIKSSGLIVNNHVQNPEPVRKCGPEMALGVLRQRDDTSPVAYSQCSGGATQAGEQQCTPAPIEHRLHLQIECCGEQRVPYIPRQASPAAYSEHERHRQQQHQTTPPRLTTASSSAVCTSPEAHRVPCAGDTAIITARSSPPASSSPLVAHQQHQHPTVRVVPTLVAAAAVVNDPCVSTLILDYSTHARHTVRPDTNSRDEPMPPPFSTNDSDNVVVRAAAEIVASSSPPSSSPPLLYPIDLSLKKHQSTVDLADLRAPVNLPLCCSSYANSPSYHDSEQYDDACCSSPNDDLFTEAWDLSVKNRFKRKYSEIDCYENDNQNVTSSVDVKPVLTPEPVKKPIKLFKPYLDDDDYSSSASSTDSRQNHLKTPKEEYFSCSRLENFKPSDVYISGQNYKTKDEYAQFENVRTKEEYYTADHFKTEDYYNSPDCGHIIVSENDCYNNNNNNNNNTDHKNSFDVGYCSNYNANPHHIFYTSPINFITRNYEFELNNSNFKTEDAIKTNQSVKQRQSYSLDFKLSAIDCYYSDAVCRGNQRAVASKYKIHRRQVQKWLKQENELRERIETSKQIHAVS